MNKEPGELEETGNNWKKLNEVWKEKIGKLHEYGSI